MPHELICCECLHIGAPRKVKRGSGKMELIMWCVFLVPGPFYSVWRLFGHRLRCVACDSDLLAELDSLIGRRLSGIVDKQLAGEIPPGMKKKSVMASAPPKADMKVVAAIGREIDEVIRHETGMGLERGLGEKENAWDGKEDSMSDPALSASGTSRLIAKDSNPEREALDKPTQRPRGRTTEQKPEDW